MATMTGTYHLAEEFRRRVFIDRGIVLSQEATFAFDPETLDSDDRQALLIASPARYPAIIFTVFNIGDDFDRNPMVPYEYVKLVASQGEPVGENDIRQGSIKDFLSFWLGSYRATKEIVTRRRAEKVAKLKKDILASPPTPTSVFHNLPSHLYRDVPGYHELVTLVQQIDAENKAKMEEKRAQEQRAKEEREARVREAAEQREQEKQRWIGTWGSEELRLMTAAGYDCQKRYVNERAAIEHPGWIVDFNDHVEYTDRSCPSVKAFVFAEANDARVVWMKSWQHDRDYIYDRQDCEAILLEEFLDRYDLYYFLPEHSAE